ncbi:MAG: addiction module protein [Planctomycetes bacterium]|nr:addiction module protein [Planctomycetota bacterium]
MSDFEELLRRTMALPAEERAALARSLLRSLEDGVDADAEAAWAAQIQQRLGELDSGEVTAVHIEDALRRISG